MDEKYEFLDSTNFYDDGSDSNVKDNWDDPSEDEEVKIVKKPVVIKPQKPTPKKTVTPVEVIELTKEQKELKIKEDDREIAEDLFGSGEIADAEPPQNDIIFDDITSFEVVLNNLADRIQDTKIYNLTLFTKVFGSFLKNALSQCEESKLHDLVQIIRNLKEEISRKNKAAKNKSKKGPTLKNAGTKLKGVANVHEYDDFMDADVDYPLTHNNIVDEDDFM